MKCKSCNEEIGNCTICPYCEENQSINYEQELSKEEKKIQKLFNKYELNTLSKKYSNAIKNINYELAGSGLSEFGNILSPDTHTSLRVQTQFLHAIVQQNWIIIRQLDEISKNINK